jgi:hypothetical protein
MEPIGHYLTQMSKCLDFQQESTARVRVLSLSLPPLLLQVCANSNHTTLERNIQTLPQRCLINDVVILTSFVDSPPNRGIMSLLPQGQFQCRVVI